MSDLMERLMKLRADFEAERDQVLDLLNGANALLDHALDPATPVSEKRQNAVMAEALMERFRMICDGQKPS